jgi:ATP/ADP translocase
MSHLIPISWPKDVSKTAVFLLSLISALILFTYALARGPSESIFLAYYHKEDLPWLGILTGFAVFLLVAGYNRILERQNLHHVLHGCFLGSAVSLGILLILYEWLPKEAIYLELGPIKIPIGILAWIRVWSDLYIIVLVEIFWTLCNLNLPMKSAAFLYGLFGAVGTLGSMLGNTMVHQLAKPLGSEKLILLVIPAFLAMNVIAIFLKPYFKVLIKSQKEQKQEQEQEHTEQIDLTKEHKDKHVQDAGIIEGFKILWRSDYLMWLLALVLCSQFAINLIDYEYSGILKQAYPNTDDRTAIQGFLYGLVDIGALVLQISTGFLIAKLGVRGSLVLIASLMLSIGSITLVLPTFFWVAALRVAGKFSTYSLFKTAKEMLYVPLSYDEQTQGKSIIDILVYRQSKILSSLLILFLSAYAYTSYLKEILCFTLVLWLLISIRLGQLAKKKKL